MQSLTMDDRTWNATVNRLSSTCLKKLDKQEFDNFIYQAHIEGKADVLAKVLTSKKKKGRYMRLLDNCYKNAGKYSCLEREFVQKVTLQALPALMEEEARKYGIKVNVGSHVGYRAKVMSDLKKMLQIGDRAGFEKYAVEKLKGNNGNFMFKVDLINLLVDDPKYAYCWSRYIELNRKLPDFVKELKKIYKADAEAFIQRMNGNPPSSINQNSTQLCQAFGKTYKLITVTIPTEFQSFIDTYFVRSKPDVLGIDVESISMINQVALIQLATRDWCCIIDVHQLSKELSAIKWKSFFEDHIFNPSITRVGFALASDYYFIGNTFPFLSSLMQRESSKSLCIKKLVENILKNPQAHRAVFPGQTPTTVSLANVAETILGVKLDKDMQRSDWSKRPLTNEQKAYAVIDAIVVLLIKDKIEDVLKQKLGPTVALKIIEEAKVSMKPEKEDPDKLLNLIPGIKIKP